MSTILGTRSATTHEFCCDKDVSDGGCLYKSFRFLNGTLKSSNNKGLRCMVANDILNHENSDSLALKTDGKYKTVEDYCNEIKKGKLYGGKAELQALAMISRLLIHVVSVTTNTDGSIDIKMLNYGEDKELSRDCIYLLYDEEKKHYHPLYIINKDNSYEKSTIFPPGDKLVDELLEKFIRQEFGGCYKQAYEQELPTKIYLINETEQLFNTVVPTTNTILSDKRKPPDHDNLSFAKITEIQPLLPTWNSDVIDKPKKLAKRNIDETPEVDKLNNGNIKQLIPLLDDNNYHPVTIEEHLQMDFFGVEYVIEMTQQSTIVSSTILNEDHEEQRMKFEVEPALKFRGRTPGDFKPKKPTNRDGEPSEARPPRYSADRNNKHVFNLLIPEKYLSAYDEHCLEVYLITRDIDGWSYVHPYFKIQVNPTDDQVPDENPVYYSFSMADLEEYLEGIKQLPLKFVIVKQINSQLMEVQQPLQIFSSSNIGSAITETYAKHGAFKDAYDLHVLRFAVTLYKSEPGETEFHRCDDIQFISQISTEDKTYKIREAQNDTNESIVNQRPE